MAIITYNEERNIGDCIQSATALGPIVIIDSGSEDGTAEIARSAGVVLLYNKWIDFSTQKQYAVDRCRTDWVLILDADERLSTDLIQEIRNLILIDPTVAYAVPRTSFFLGKEVKYCGWRPDYVVRLFNKKFCSFNGRSVHESISGFEKLCYLKNQLMHYSYLNDSDIERKIELYSDLGARSISEKRSNISSLECLLRAYWIFLKTFVIKLGALDGVTGLNISLMNFRGTYLKYKKAQHLLRSSN